MFVSTADELKFQIKREGSEEFVVETETQLSDIELKLLLPVLDYAVYCTPCGTNSCDNVSNLDSKTVENIKVASPNSNPS